MKRLLITAVPLLAAVPAAAHHPLNGMPMETFSHGVLSGVGHPLLGFDHLLFVIAAGVLAALTMQRAASIAAYVAAMAFGCLLMVGGFDPGLKEMVIALSLLVVGGVLMTGRGAHLSVAVALLAGFGVFHGAAFGDSIAGQEATAGLPVLVGYLLGLAAVQAAVAWAAGSVVRWGGDVLHAQAINARLAGALVAGAGVFLTLELAEGAMFNLLGLAV